MLANVECRSHVMDGILKSRKYVDTFLKIKLTLFIRDFFPCNATFFFFFYQQDSVFCHTAHICKHWFAENDIKMLENVKKQPIPESHRSFGVSFEKTDR